MHQFRNHHYAKKGLEEFNKSSKGWIFDKFLKYEERFLREGDKLFVLGEVNDFDGYNPIFRSETTRLLITDKSRDEYINTHKNKPLILLLRWLVS